MSLVLSLSYSRVHVAKQPGQAAIITMSVLFHISQKHGDCRKCPIDFDGVDGVVFLR